MRRIVLSFMFIAFCLEVCFAGPDEKEKSDDSQKRIEGIESQIKDLERKRERIEIDTEGERRQEELREEFADIQNNCQEQLKGYQEQLRELEVDNPEAEDNYAQVFSQHLKKVSKLLEQIMSITDTKRIDKVRKLEQMHATLVTKWWLLRGPELGFIQEMTGMEENAGENGNQEQKLLIKLLKELHKQDMTNRKQEFELMQTRTQIERQKGQLIERFWNAVDEGKDD